MERDFPIGHPAASDYNGEPYNPPRAPYGEDFPEGHPARGGANISPLDTADGMRAALLQQPTDLVALASVGSLPPLIDPEKHKAVSLEPEELAQLYALRNGLLPEAQVAEVAAQVIKVLSDRGFSPEKAKSLIDGYCVPLLQK